MLGLEDGYGLKLTTARYYTPSGRSIQALGVAPDIIVNQRPKIPEEELDRLQKKRSRLTESDLRGALSNDSLNDDEKEQLDLENRRKENSAAIKEEDYQISYALDIIRGLTIYNEEKL